MERAIRIRLRPNAEQRQKLMRWFGAHRLIYNLAIDATRHGVIPMQQEAIRSTWVNESALRKLADEENARLGILPAKKPRIRRRKAKRQAKRRAKRFRPESPPAAAHYNKYEALLQTPYDLRDDAMRDLLKALHSNLAKREKAKADGKDPGKFQLHFKSRKRMDSESFTVLCKHWSSPTGAWAWLRDIPSERNGRRQLPPPNQLTHDMRLQRTKAGAFYLCVPLPAAATEGDETQVPPPSGAVVALDPGVRTFQTCYDPQSLQCYKWGSGDMGKIIRLCLGMDKLISKLATGKQQHTVNHRRRWKMKQALSRIRAKIRNLVDDLHRKLIKWLCENYRLVLLPSFDTSVMLSKKGARRRVINSETARMMATWAHYRFKQRLLSKASTYAHCMVEIVDESYTSMTCGRCGTLNRDIHNAEVFWCLQCGYAADRDFNGARNIYLRYLCEQQRTTSAGAVSAPALKPIPRDAGLSSVGLPGRAQC